ncbi:MAG: zinc metallopeptidase [Candidatus Eisenbacteria bacterium]|uniref:Zinc metallopeptidase n=1 Tax=Eiseniibacteriota bacterium TaxID=2212470 RepID=A0A948RZ88_UNCEI|nr:zinc metallopeptidase [Candidatus Eisenbacteria bacterium]MBU1950550.1 zinc metallopeptidase [Candidatus Eisenbacteria bacterium]MBU2690964.1 zinc metallopeptidase [Candidatus Eisenbacteria bacterium]
MIIGPTILLSIWAQAKVSSTFKKYSKIASTRGLTGADTAKAILRSFGIQDVTVERNQGFLSDHYDPIRKSLRLSPNVYDSPSLAAIGVAAHEVGHAIQHAEGYFPLKIRSAMVPVTKIGSQFSWPLLIIGMIFQSLALVKIGIIFFSAVVLFQIVTLPVEFDASRRAVGIIEREGILTSNENRAAKTVLSAAALTYVAAAAASIAQLLYFLLRSGLLGGRRR